MPSNFPTATTEASSSQDHAPPITAVTSGQSHTPGPWTLGVASCFIGDDPAPAGWTGVSADGWGDLALVVTRLSDEPFDHPQGVANASLIAAAPELRDELMALVTAVTYVTPPKDFGTPSDPNPCFEARVPVEFVERARAAIDKADGFPPSSAKQVFRASSRDEPKAEGAV